MFDLFRSRDKAVRYLLGVLLGIVALSMVITLVPSYGGYGSGGDPTVLAEIGGEKITALEVRQVIQREMQRGSIPRGMAEIYIPMIVQQLVAQRAVTYQAERMGIKMTDQELADTVHAILPQLFEGGKFAGKDAYAQVLAQQNMTIPEFEGVLKKQATATRLESLALEGVIVTPQEVEREYKLKNDKVKVSYFGITPEAAKGKVTATPQEISDYFAKNRAAYNIPEKRSFLIFPIDEDKVAATIQVSDADLEASYKQQIERYRTPERVRVRHILLKTTDKPEAEVAKLQKRMEELLKQAKSGADFAELAKKNSEDTLSAVKGGDLDWVTRGQMVADFEKAAFALKPGEISPVVKTQYGFHIVKMDAREDARVKPFPEVKDELRGELAKGKALEKMQGLADQIHMALVKSPAEAEKLAASAGIAPVRAEKAAAGDPVQEVGANPDFLESVRKLPKNGVTPVIQISPSKLVVAQVTDVFPSHPAELADVQNAVRDALLAQKGNELVQAKIKEAQAKLGSINGDLAALAKAEGAELKTSEVVTREGAITGLGPANMFSQAWDKNVGDVFGPVSVQGGTYFVKVLEKQPADLTQLAATREQMVQAIKARRARERQELFADGIVSSLTKDKKVKVYEDNIKKLAAAFRS